MSEKKDWKNIKLQIEGSARPYIIAITSAKYSPLTTLSFGEVSGGGPEWPYIDYADKVTAAARLQVCWNAMAGIDEPKKFMDEIKIVLEHAGDGSCSTRMLHSKKHCTSCLAKYLLAMIEGKEGEK